MINIAAIALTAHMLTSAASLTVTTSENVSRFTCECCGAPVVRIEDRNGWDWELAYLTPEEYHDGQSFVLIYSEAEDHLYYWRAI